MRISASMRIPSRDMIFTVVRMLQKVRFREQVAPSLKVQELESKEQQKCETAAAALGQQPQPLCGGKK